MEAGLAAGLPFPAEVLLLHPDRLMPIVFFVGSAMNHVVLHL